jgi:DNA-binding response OmpR family regulator
MHKTILVIDDDVDLVDKIRDRLEDQKYNIIGAFDGEDGLEKARSESPDLIILDIVMPKMNGHELATRLKADQRTRLIPILVLTAHNELVKFFNPGEIVGYLIKPVKIRDLLFQVREAIGEVRAKSILLIDENSAAVEDMDRTLRMNRFAVFKAGNGKEGLEKAVKELPDLIICDALMPVMNGHEFVRAIKKDEKLAGIPLIILLSGGINQGSFAGMDVDDFAVKPLDDVTLITKVKFLLKQKSLVLCQDEVFLGRITTVLRERNFGVQVVKDEGEMAAELQKVRYEVVVAYLPSVQMEPQDFISAVHTYRNRNMKTIIYSSSKVKGTESDNISVIRDIQRKWLKAKADGFFDLRISEEDFPVVLDSSLGRIEY